MMRSLSSAVGGLRAHQTKMDVIGNNIAKVNTYGFKASRTTFSDVYYQTVSGGNSPSNTTGGTNPTQIGYGAVVATIDVLNTQAGMASTDRALDLYINGDGMIATKDASGNLKYSRLGILGFDAEGNLVDANGAYVQGMAVDRNGQPIINADGTIDVGDLVNITVDTEMLDKLTGISIGTTGEITGVLPGDPKFSMTKGIPDWLQDIIIAEDSNMSGKISVTMEQTATYTPANFQLDNWITKVEASPNMGVAGLYTFDYDKTKTKDNLTATGPNGEVLTGTYKARGDVVEMKDLAGNVVMTVTTDTRLSADTMTGKTINFDSTWDLTVSGTNKGGVAQESTVSYTDPSLIPATVNFADLGITLSVDPTKVVPGTQAKIQNTPGAFGWLNSSYIDPNNETIYDPGSINLEVYSKYGPTYSPAAAANWVNEAAIKQLMEDEGLTGEYRIGWQLSGTGPNVQYDIYIGSSTTSIATGTAALSSSITLTSVAHPSNSYVIGAPSALGAEGARATAFTDSLYDTAGIKALIDKTNKLGDYEIEWSSPSTDVYTFTVTDPSGTVIGTTTVGNNADIKINGVTIGKSPGAGASPAFAVASTPTVFGSGTVKATNPNYILGSVSKQNVIKATDATGHIIGETVYTNGSTVKVGDLVLSVTEQDLKDYFDNNVGVPGTLTSIGTLTNISTPQWAFNGKAGDAQAGEGEVLSLGIIALAKFPNMSAMEEAGASYFIESANSGAPTFTRPGLNGTGTTKSGYLEMSNVDIAKEFTDMITTQRGFQANTRIITVSDEMLQELVNLKR